MELTFDKRMFEVLQDGIMILSSDKTCLYVNSEHRRLWIGTDSMTTPNLEYRSINPTVDHFVASRSHGTLTIPISKGSDLHYYYLYCFPINGDYYVILTRDVTNVYLQHERDEEYRELFNTMFASIRFPLAIVDRQGIVNRFTPAFSYYFSDEITLANGSFIWDFFKADRPAIKELFEEMVENRSPFEKNGFRFVPVSDRWFQVYCVENIQAETEITEENIKDYLTFFRVLRSFKGLPWRTIIMFFLLLVTLVGRIDPQLLIELLDNSTEQVQP